MGGDSFRFKQFKICQSHSAMKVGTDGVLLGAWVELLGKEHTILDVGTGTGLIALMVAQRTVGWGATIDAVEVETAAAKEAKENAAASPWADRVKVENIDFQTFALHSTVKYDLIVSNPPYFNGTYKSQDQERTAARHSELLNSDDLLSGVTRILAFEGRFAAIFPYQTAAIFIAKAVSYGLFCNRIIEIYSKPSSGIKRVMADFSFIKGHLFTQRLTILGADGEYSDDLRDLTSSFYLKF